MEVFRKRSYFACWIIDSKQIAFLILFCFFIPLNIVHIYEASGMKSYIERRANSLYSSLCLFKLHLF